MLDEEDRKTFRTLRTEAERHERHDRKMEMLRFWAGLVLLSLVLVLVILTRQEWLPVVSAAFLASLTTAVFSRQGKGP